MVPVTVPAVRADRLLQLSCYAFAVPRKPDMIVMACERLNNAGLLLCLSGLLSACRDGGEDCPPRESDNAIFLDK